MHHIFVSSSSPSSSIAVHLLQIPERISVAAGQMLLTITHAVRPHHLTQIPAVQKFIVLGAKGEFNTLPLVVGASEHRCA